MKRKVMKVADSSALISLPFRWVQKNNIKKGDELDVEEKEDRLIVSSDGKKSQLSITSDVRGLKPRLVDRFLARAYQKGYDHIKLLHESPQLLNTIQEKTHELIGFEIIEKDETQCVIQSISSKIELDFDTSLRKAFLQVKEMARTCYDYYEKAKYEQLESIYLRDMEVNRMCYFCLRKLNTEKTMDTVMAHQSNVLYYLVENLEDLGDNFKALASTLAKMKQGNNYIKEILNDCLDLFEISYSYFYQPRKERANESYELFKNTEQKIMDGSDKVSGKEEFISLMYLREIAHIIYHYTTMRLDYMEGMQVNENV